MRVTEASANKVSGHCLCGAVSFTATAKSHEVLVCHCSMCSRWAGGIAMFVEIFGAPEFKGQETIGVYRSSPWGERGFCNACGTSLFWKLAGKERYTLSAAALDDKSRLRLATEIFIEDKPDYYSFANDTCKQTGEEAMAAFVGEGVKS